ETAYGVDSLPNGATDAVLARNFSFSPLEGAENAREYVKSHMGANPNAPLAGLQATVEFDVDLTGAGVAGSLPPYHAMMRACGFAATINAGVSVVYNPISAGLESVTAYVFRDGILHKIIGARGDWNLALNAQGEPILHFKLLGNYVPVSDAVLPSVTLPSVTPLAVDAAHTPVFNILGQTPPLSAFELAGNHDLQYRSLVGDIGRVNIFNRDMGGTITIEEPSVATFDYWNASINGTIGAMNIQHGTTAGNIVEISCAQTQIGKINTAENNGVSALAIPFKALPSSAGNDDVVLTVR
ncbi:MAG: hypothetical protein R8M45_08690, partial [Ghiorsea sp.]